MRKKTLWQTWLESYTTEHPLFNHFILFFASFSFIVSDWMLGVFSFSELLLGFLATLLFLFGKFRVHKPQIKWISLPIVIIITHSIIHHVISEGINWRTVLISLIKLAFYLILTTGFYNYVRVQKLEKSFLLWNNIAAMVVCVLAVYIMTAIYLDGAIPWRPLVTFTRTGGNVFSRDPLIVRAKSIFMEPAHLGYYLNTVLAFNLFSKKIKMPYIFSIILVLIIMATFAYTAIAIMAFTLVSYFGRKLYTNELKLDKRVCVVLGLVVAGFVAFFWESIYLTLINRTLQLIQGEESSGYERLVLTWQYVERDNIWLGHGFMHTPIIWNNFAYVLTDLGIVPFIISLIGAGYLTYVNSSVGLFFILMNFAKGGYLSPAYWFLILLVLLYSFEGKKEELNGLRKEDYRVTK